MWPPTPFRLIPCVYGCGLFRKGKLWGGQVVAKKKINHTYVIIIMIIIAHTCFFFRRNITCRVDDFDWISVFDSKFCLEGVGGQTTCKNLGFFFLLTQDVNKWRRNRLLFLCLFLGGFRERRRKAAQDDVIHHTSCLSELYSFMLLLEGEGVSPPRFSFPPHTFFCLKKPSKFSLSGFDLVGSFLDYYDVVSGPPEMTIERLFFYCVCETSLSSYF